MQDQKIIQLGDHIDLTCRDFDLEIFYRNVIAPDKKRSGYWEMFYRNWQKLNEAGEPEKGWETSPGLLSGNYKVVLLSNVIKEIEEQVGAELTFLDNHIEKSVICRNYILPKVTLKVDETEARENAVIFQLLFGQNVQTVEDTHFLKLHVVNSYDGTKKLNMIYSLCLVGEGDNIINNPYITIEKDLKVIHNTTANINFKSADEVITDISARIEQWKQIKPDDMKLNTLVKRHTGKRVYEYIMGIWSQLPEDMKNLYYLTILFASKTDSLNKVYNYRKSLETILRYFTDSI